MSAVMWKVVHLKIIKHYGKVEEFVSLVSEAIPDILTSQQMTLLTLGLRAKVRKCTVDSVSTCISYISIMLKFLRYLHICLTVEFLILQTYKDYVGSCSC